MPNIFLNIVVGLSCVLMMSCSTVITKNSFTEPLETQLVDNLDGTFTDKRNLLQWTINDSTPGPGLCYGGRAKNFFYSELHLECMNKQKYLGYNDWRMPSYNELESLLNVPEIKSGTFLKPQTHERLRNHAYWSTTDLAIIIYKRGIMIYNVKGPIYIYNMRYVYYVWPVRSKIQSEVIVASERNQ